MHGKKNKQKKQQTTTFDISSTLLIRGTKTEDYRRTRNDMYMLIRITEKLNHLAAFPISHSRSVSSVHKVILPFTLSPSFSVLFPSFGIDVWDVRKVDSAYCLVCSGARRVFQLQHKKLVGACAVKRWRWHIQRHLGAFLWPVAAKVEIIHKRLTLKCSFGKGRFKPSILFD